MKLDQWINKNHGGSVAAYARANGITVQGAYKQIKRGDIVKDGDRYMNKGKCK